MQMVWSRGTALRTVVEYHQFAVQTQKSVHLAIVLEDGLRLMLACRNREMYRKDRERIDQQVETFVYLLGHLYLRTVLLAEEAWTLIEGLLVYLGTCAHDAGRVPLQLEKVGESLALHVLQVAVAMAGILPSLQLAVEEA